jgi:hypothetical protein
MKTFIIHRFQQQKDARKALKYISNNYDIQIDPIFLDSSEGEIWKEKAAIDINNSEAVIVYDLESCNQSENAHWEIEKTKEYNKPLVCICNTTPTKTEIEKLLSTYNHDIEFNSFFKKDYDNTEDLYKIMIDSSEQLIKRRQSMNAFFITAIGGLSAVAGALIKFGTIKNPTTSFLFLSSFGIIGLLLCNSWRNLIDNYGKLNTAKFRVILHLEQSLSAQIFSAEWTALGKGTRPRKYRSFTATENAVPLWFAILLFCLIQIASVWRICG